MAIFASLSEKLSSSIKKISGKASLSEKNIQDTLREVRIALLEAAEAMNKAKMENLKFSEMDIVKSIEKYNYVDVKVIDDIITFLRTKI